MEYIGNATADFEQFKKFDLIQAPLSNCYFIADTTRTSATICAICGKEKFLHTIGEGIKASTIIIQH